MITDDNTFLLRFFGDNIHPQSFSAKELGTLLIKLEDSVKGIAEEQYPKSNLDNIFISLVNIKDKSQSLAFAALGDEASTQSFLDWGNSINKNTYTNLPEKAYDGLKYLNTLVKRKNCALELVYKNKQLYQIEPSFKFTSIDNIFIKVETELYGKLVKIGGEKTPKLWLEQNDGKVLSFETTIEKAQNLSPQLYSTIGLKGIARWNTITKSISQFKLLDILDYKSGGISDAFKQLRNISSGVWDKYNTDEDILNFIRND
jgi:hypothetical protein